MKLASKLFVLAFLLAFASTALAVIEHDQMKVFAVSSNDERAMSAGLGLTLKAGEGKIWSSVDPLIGTSTQTTERISVEVAKNYSDKVNQFDYFFDINSTASLVDGPSAGAAMALLTISMLQNKTVPDNVSITGTIAVDGSVGAVGGVFKKSQEAARIGMDLFMIPEGEGRQMVKFEDEVRSVSLPEYAKNEWGLTVVEVKNISEALDYAFSDIQSIDINKGSSFVPEFVPNAITVPESLGPMVSLTSNYLTRAEREVKDARTSLSGTLLAEPALIDAMLSLVNQSEKTLEKAKLLYEKNYLYSSANFAFLAIVNASLVKDISDNPALLEEGSLEWGLKITELKKKASSLKRDLNSFVPVDRLEWHIAAKERLVWAEEKLDVLAEEANTIIVTVNGNAPSEERLSKLTDLAYASAWLDAAEDFHRITIDSEKKVSAASYTGTSLDSYIETAESALPLLEDAEKEDVLRRLDAAKISKQRGWYSSALFDAASALALANATIYVRNKDKEELNVFLKTKTNELRNSIDQSGRSFVWAELYLAHAIYYSEAADFYLESGQTENALDMLKSGISLFFLADNMFNVGSETYAFFESIPSEQYMPVSQQPGFFVPNATYLFILLGLLGIAITVLLYLLLKISKHLKEVRRYSIDDRISDFRRKEATLEKRFAAGKLTEKDYDSKSLEYHVQLSNLLHEKSELSHLIIDLDRDKAMLLAFEKALRSLIKREKKGTVIKADYRENLGFYNREILRLRNEIEGKKSAICRVENGSKPKPVKYPLAIVKTAKSVLKPKTKLVVKKSIVKKIAVKKPVATNPSKKKLLFSNKPVVKPKPKPKKPSKK